MEQAQRDGKLFGPYTPEAIQLFAQAARAANLPESWGSEDGLHKILAKESGGWVGRPNYQFAPLDQLINYRRWSEVWDSIRAGTWRTKLAEPYRSYEAGRQSSATGLGQLTQTNIKLKNPNGTFKYYPRGLDSIGVAHDEAIGMLAYIKDRYQTPTNAWAQYGKGHEGY